MSLSLKLVGGFNKIQKNINAAIADFMNIRIRSRSKRAEKRLRDLMRVWIMEQDEIQSLLNQGVIGSLNAKFGLPPGTPEVSVEVIIQTVIDSIEVLFTKVDKNLAGGIEFRIHPDVLVKLLRLPEGFVTTERGQDLHWLDWLLTKGDTNIVLGYRYKPDRSGRSGGGTMTGGSSFRVDPEYSGTINDNFITRAFSNRDAQLSSILSDLFT